MRPAPMRRVVARYLVGGIPLEQLNCHHVLRQGPSPAFVRTCKFCRQQRRPILRRVRVELPQ